MTKLFQAPVRRNTKWRCNTQTAFKVAISVPLGTLCKEERAISRYVYSGASAGEVKEGLLKLRVQRAAIKPDPRLALTRYVDSARIRALAKLCGVTDEEARPAINTYLVSTQLALHACSGQHGSLPFLAARSPAVDHLTHAYGALREQLCQIRKDRNARIR